MNKLRIIACVICQLLYNIFNVFFAWVIMQIPVDISHILGNLITVIFDYQILRKPLKILSL